ncbi:MAG: membrane protein insertase YidC, partial [Mariniphaga sp.]|nr:membrane protein insertase YidC [Mariniphaga sp.]
MDKKSILGILLIFAILVVFSIMNRPSKEEQDAKRKRDSIAQVEAERAVQLQLEQQALANQQDEQIVVDPVSEQNILQDKINELGVFGSASIGEEEFYTFENNLLKITLSNKGGRIYSVELKDYQTHDSLPLTLFDGPETQYSLNFSTSELRTIQTSQLYFTPSFQGEGVVVPGSEVKKGDIGDEKFNEKNPGDSKSVSFKIEIEPGKSLEYIYTLKHNSYLVDFDVKLNGLNSIIASNQSFLSFLWSFDVPRQETISKFGEDRYTNIQYKFFEGDLEQLSQNKSDSESLSTRIKWIGFKQLFFNSTIIAGEFFPNARVASEKYEDNPKYLSNFSTDIALPYEGQQNEQFDMQFYFGPNHYKTLKQYDLDLERLVYLGYAIVRPVNKYLIIPVFNFLRDYINNFGIIILLLTIFIKTLVFPFTYKSFISQAKMRALKPEIDEITSKFGADKAMEKQQATMALYKKAGVSPMGGCLPMLFQFPFLIAMFFFFPTSIELRQQSFLWAHDLSTFDAIISWDFDIPLV